MKKTNFSCILSIIGISIIFSFVLLIPVGKDDWSMRDMVLKNLAAQENYPLFTSPLGWMAAPSPQ